METKKNLAKEEVVENPFQIKMDESKETISDAFGISKERFDALGDHCQACDDKIKSGEITTHTQEVEFLTGAAQSQKEAVLVTFLFYMGMVKKAHMMLQMAQLMGGLGSHRTPGGIQLP